MYMMNSEQDPNELLTAVETKYGIRPKINICCLLYDWFCYWFCCCLDFPSDKR